ncbi:hypothetical protein Pst134EA_013789 [Puccinia striiformis f. sp. tritici]|uniref:hypothetical protein n=1 Tax=Puccinia striiformis f. sp. tritici TaxID=168172 RepID=UPI00200786A0|nr:hypothetical protein Pst134EA_013789 [Puccinia striiformis f. sp. tritici]KAH9465934.1 hypothetical protein Pst134EA_013789 [Puccinia striiformis f. sp. tritici]
MLAQRNIFLVASAFVSSHLFLNVHGLALPLSSQTQGGYSSYPSGTPMLRLLRSLQQALHQVKPRLPNSPNATSLLNIFHET